MRLSAAVCKICCGFCSCGVVAHRGLGRLAIALREDPRKELIVVSRCIRFPFRCRRQRRRGRSATRSRRRSALPCSDALFAGLRRGAIADACRDDAAREMHALLADLLARPGSVDGIGWRLRRCAARTSLPALRGDQVRVHRRLLCPADSGLVRGIDGRYVGALIVDRLSARVGRGHRRRRAALPICFDKLGRLVYFRLLGPGEEWMRAVQRARMAIGRRRLRRRCRRRRRSPRRRRQQHQ
mmetsp:Transcript_79195/g.229034  ORF Transcript_79195/g.229034 Transcript_79195/m.229034 type:complete len:241 (-) Transcript_79195:367-1089(-)